MSYANPSDVPDNVPVKYRPQFMEVWNSVYAAAIADKKSPAQAEEDAFKQAHGVINKQKAKDERDVSSDGPGFGPVRDGQPGGQVADPTQSMRYSDDQPRDEHGKFGSGNGNTVAEKQSAVDAASAKHTEAINSGKEHDIAAAAAAHQQALNELQGAKHDASTHEGRVPIKIGKSTYYAKYSPAESNQPNAMPTYHAETKEGTYVMHLVQNDVNKYHDAYKGAAKQKDDRAITLQDGPGFGRDSAGGGQVADPEMTLRMRRVAALMLGEEWRFAEDQLRGPDGKFASNAGENAHTTEEHLKAQSEHIGKAREALKAGDHDTAAAHGDAAAAHSKAAFTGKEDQEAVGDVARVASKVANDKSGIK